MAGAWDCLSARLYEKCCCFLTSHGTSYGGGRGGGGGVGVEHASVLGINDQRT